MKKFSHESLKISLAEVDEQSDLDISINLKSPDRSHNWKASRLQRSKTYSGSPSNRIYDYENIENDAVKSNDKKDAPRPLSPVNQRKWGKTNMKRRSSNARLTKTTTDKFRTPLESNVCQSVTGDSCETTSTMKIEVRRATDISDQALLHRYCCPCKQYFDSFTNVIYKLQEHEDIFDSNKLSYCNVQENLNREDSENFDSTLHTVDQSTEKFANRVEEILVAAQPESDLMDRIQKEIFSDKVYDCSEEKLSSQIHELLHSTDVLDALESAEDKKILLDVTEVHTPELQRSPRSARSASCFPDIEANQIMSTFCVPDFTPTQTVAESTRMEDVSNTGDSNSSFDVIDIEELDDSIVELKSLRNDISLLDKDFRTELSPRICCEKSVKPSGNIHPYILESMSDSEGSVVYILIAVFSYLDLQSLYNAGTVCRTWHCASQHPAVWSNVMVKGRRLSQAAFHNLSISCVSTQSITFQDCVMEGQQQTESCEKEVKEMFCVMSNSLTSLKLIDTAYSDVLLNLATVHCSSLKRVTISGGVSSDAIADNSNLACLTILQSQISPRPVESFEKLKMLKCISLQILPDDFHKLISGSPALQRLHLTKSPSLHSKDIAQCPSLTKLLLTDTYISPRAIIMLLLGAPVLEVLSVEFSAEYSARLGKLDHYMEGVQVIQGNPLFRDKLKFSVKAPSKPPRAPTPVLSKHYAL